MKRAQITGMTWMIIILIIMGLMMMFFFTAPGQALISYAMNSLSSAKTGGIL